MASNANIASDQHRPAAAGSETHYSFAHGPIPRDAPPLLTSHSTFLDTTTLPPRSILLRGVNLASSAKVPRSRPVKKGGDGPASDDRVVWLSPADDVAHGDAGDGAGHRMHSHILEGFWEGQEAGGEPDGWFNGGTLDLDDADEHLERLRGWGFNVVRYIVTWESLEHAGPGKYDDAFISWTIEMLKKIASYGFRVYIDPHQDIWSRATGGAGAPYWTLLACGLAPRRFSSTSAAYLQCEWPEEKGGPQGFPDMIWQTNLHRLAARTMYTTFFAGETFAPKCIIDGQNIQHFLQGHFNEAYGRLADAIAREDDGALLDTCVIGWDSLNEPGEGFIEIPDLNVLPPAQDFKKGPSPTPLQGFMLGIGQPQRSIEEWEFGAVGPKKVGSVDLTPQDGLGCWLTRSEADAAAKQFGWRRDYDFWGDEPESTGAGDIWAAHGVWDRQKGKMLVKDYFHHPSDKPSSEAYSFLETFWPSQWTGYMRRIHRSHPNAICFVNPPVFAKPPSLPHSTHHGRLALSAHFYDALTMLNKRRHVYGADAVAIQRGTKSIPRAFKIGDGRVRASISEQIKELASDATNEESLGEVSERGGQSGRYPVIIGETGVPFDLRPSALWGLAKGSTGKGDYAESTKALDSVLNGCDGENVVGYTIWNYETRNTWKWGDGWNGENLSLWSKEDQDQRDASSTTRTDATSNRLSPTMTMGLDHLLTSGTRALEAFCRPYAVATVGTLVSQRFDIAQAKYEIEVVVGRKDGPDRYAAAAATAAAKGCDATALKTTGTTPPPVLATTVIYLPYVHFRATESTSATSSDSQSSAASSGSSSTRRTIRGQPDPDETRPWSSSSLSTSAHPPVLSVDINLSEQGSSLEIIGQYAFWRYDYDSKTTAMERDEGGRKVRLMIKRHGGSLWK